ncbi:helix-turn-helix transcriptional regulator [Streptomyces sp. Z423-1]|uniref:ATP-binding protein n=1 Tax=unclassified Streptomyces TaxID=2593676 RepID=UPI001488E677|nr:helix-turn-helix transcriptional regulator [Streptomyces sp. Z423-1]
MLGRSKECRALDQLAASVRAGQSAALVLRGEAGIGKTALLDHLAESAVDCRVARAGGTETEMELPFAGLHQLCGPLIEDIDHLPDPQRDALGIAFGLSKGAAPNRFLIGLAVLSQLAVVAEERPLICLVDDAQWLDRASAQVLGFVARRLVAESVGFVFAVRASEDEEPVFEGLPELSVRGLNEPDARSLLDSVAPGRIDERIRSRILGEARGNPLALLELPRGWTVVDLAGGFARPEAQPVASRIEQSFLTRVQSLPPATQRLLLIAAAEPVGDVTLLRRAAERLGIGMDAAAPALAAGLLELGTRVRFRHPLVRSATYRAAALSDRKEVHRALAEVTDADAGPDRRAWHRAHATVVPDEAVAVELVRSADRARGRGGVAAAAAFLERAMELTPDPALRGTRALAAAQAKFEAAAPEAAYRLAKVAELGPLDELERARLARLHAHVVFARGCSGAATPLFIEAAKQLEPHDAALAREACLEALAAAIFAGRLADGLTVRDAAEAARNAPRGPGLPGQTDLLLDGVSARFTEGYAASVEPLQRAVRVFHNDDWGDQNDVTRRLWLACPVAPELVAPELWDDEAWHELAGRAVRLARNAGALAVLPMALAHRAAVHVLAGEFATASALIDEADAITRATGNAPQGCISLMVVAWRDDEHQAMKSIDAGIRNATAKGDGRTLGMAHYFTALLHNGLGRYDVALGHAQQACAYEDLGCFGWYLAESVEAGVRSGDHDAAVAALARLVEMTDAAGTDWALGVQARSRALLSEGDAAERLYREAIERLGRTRIRLELARAHLLYGEWLRRESRRVDARDQLRTAHEMFTGFGAGVFTERASRELRATGETVAKRTTTTPTALTAQEAQIARLARDGLTNRQIGAQLFISAHTVEWHLRKVFAKLGITSRRQLRGALSGRASTTAPA